jgi:hypothetical protein
LEFRKMSFGLERYKEETKSRKSRSGPAERQLIRAEVLEDSGFSKRVVSLFKRLCADEVNAICRVAMCCPRDRDYRTVIDVAEGWMKYDDLLRLREVLEARKD